MFYPPKGLCKAEPNRVHLIFFTIYLEKGVWHFQNPDFLSAFLKSWKCFIPRKGSPKALPMGSNWFSFGLFSLVNENWSLNFGAVFRLKISAKILYPPKGSTKALPMGSNWFSYGLLSLVNEKWSFNFALVIRQKNSAKILYCADGRTDGRMDGWMDGDQKCPSIFLIFKYVNK